MWSELLAGIASSLIAVALVEAYLQTRRLLRHRKLRAVVGFNGRSSQIITPAWAVPNSSGLYGSETKEFPPPMVVGSPDVFASALAIEICRRVGSEPTLTASGTVGIESNLSANIVCVGGWSGNSVSDSFIRSYCPGFRIVNREKEVTDFFDIYYECGENIFRDDDDVAHGFLVKLGPRLTGLNGPTILIWGHRGVATIASAHFLSERYGDLYGLERDSFFVALKVRQRLGYRAISRGFVDITDDAFVLGNR